MLVLAMFLVGTWLAYEIERNAIKRAAAVSSVYMESILAAELHHGSVAALQTAATQEALDLIFKEGPLRRKVVRFKLWDADGAILYSNDHGQTGKRFPVGNHLANAFAGKVEAHISHLDEDDNQAERSNWGRLLEIYVPVRPVGRDEIFTVGEFYLTTENLDREIEEAKLRSWGVVAAGTLLIFLLMFAQVRRANDTMQQQRDDLRRQVQQLRAAVEDNERMRLRLGEAGAATTALNEEFLQRIAADLHDGPAQALAFVLMRFDELVESCGGCSSRVEGAAMPDLPRVRRALRIALDDLRNIAAGLGVPGIAELTLAETARRAVRDCERQFALKIDADIDATLGDATLATKITVYRLLQESLANSARHAPGGEPRVRVWREDEAVCLEIADQGAGFDPQVAARSGRLGLAFMQERVRLLGGVFEIATAPGQGTRIRARLPLVTGGSEHG